MTAPDALRALADRAEAATGPDRGLDAEIALATGFVRERDGDCFYGAGDYSVMVLERGYNDHLGNAPELPHYTASLDAAITLFAPDDTRVINLSIGPWNAGQCRTWRATEPDEVTIGDAATLPLAICAAALRVRALAKEANDD